MVSRLRIRSHVALVPASLGSALVLLLFAATLVLPAFASAAARHATPRATPSTIALSSGSRQQVTAMSFRLSTPAQVRAVIVRDGKIVRMLRSGTMRRGAHRVAWDGTGDPGAIVSAGTYAFAVTIRRTGRRALVYRSAVTVSEPQTPASTLMTLAWPLDGAVSSPFGPRGTGRHDGIDIPAASGTPIGAAAAGRVVSAGSMQGYGLTVVIEHDTTGMRTLYAHQSRLAVVADQVVSTGHVIGYVGHTGISSGDHLHFELRGADNVAIDPQPSLPPRVS